MIRRWLAQRFQRKMMMYLLNLSDDNFHALLKRIKTLRVLKKNTELTHMSRRRPLPSNVQGFIRFHK